MKTKTILTLFALLFAQSVSALTVNTALEGTSSVSAPIPTAVQVGATAGTGSDLVNGVAAVNADVSTAMPASATNTTAEVMTENSSSQAQTSVDTDSDTKVTVTYKRPAKLFGFIPVNIKERATVKVEDDGTRTADVSRSWWAFLATKAEVKTEEFLSHLKSRLQASASVNSNAKLSATDKTQLVSEINAAADATYR